jgi:hypothetical protein
MQHPSHDATQLNRKLTSMLTNQTGLITGTAAVRSIKAEQEERNEQHFKTDHLLPNLKQHTISSAAVTMSARGAKFLLNVASKNGGCIDLSAIVACASKSHDHR